jgi:hypothetical protein
MGLSILFVKTARGRKSKAAVSDSSGRRSRKTASWSCEFRDGNVSPVRDLGNLETSLLRRSESIDNKILTEILSAISVNDTDQVVARIANRKRFRNKLKASDRKMRATE